MRDESQRWPDERSSWVNAMAKLKEDMQARASVAAAVPWSEPSTCAIGRGTSLARRRRWTIWRLGTRMPRWLWTRHGRWDGGSET